MAEYLGLVGARHQRYHHIVEGSLKVEGGGQRLAIHPQHAEALVVGHHGPGYTKEDVFRRQGDADHG